MQVKCLPEVMEFVEEESGPNFFCIKSLGSLPSSILPPCLGIERNSFLFVNKAFDLSMSHFFLEFKTVLWLFRNTALLLIHLSR